MTDHEKQIIENEIKRLERAYKVAQERYGFTGSASTDKTMYKYDTLKNALENYLYRREEDAHEKAMYRYLDQLERAHKRVEDGFRAGKIEPQTYAEIVRILMEG